MKKSKKILALLLAIVMIVTVVPLTVFAVTSGDWEYYVKDDGTVSINHYNGSAKEVKIPSEIDGYIVTEIFSHALDDCVLLESVDIPDSITSVGALYSCCDSLKSINVSSGNTVFSSEDGVLFNKDKTELILYPNGKTDKVYEIPDSVISIDGYRSFGDCTSLETIIMPSSIANISSTVFMGCSSLREIKVSSNNNAYISIDGVLLSKDKAELVHYPQGKKARLGERRVESQSVKYRKLRFQSNFNYRRR